MKLVLLLLCILPYHITSQKLLMYAGTYTRNGSQGIYVFSFDKSTGQLTLLSSTKSVINPSFLAISPDKKYLYAAEENNPGTVSAFAIHPSNGELSFINSQSSGGSGPCYISTDRTGKWCFVANYSSGSISVLPITHNGSLQKPIQTIQHDTVLAMKIKDGKPHAHSINMASNNKDVFVTDLGTDKIMCYSFDEKSGSLLKSNIPYIKTSDGSGPRHFAFHPNGKFAYCILETTSEIVAYKSNHQTLKHLHTISTLPEDSKEINYCADIHVSIDGKFLYGSNRGHNSIVIYSINRKTGLLKLVGHQSTIGDFPRNFVIEPGGNFLLVANQKSDNIQIFKIDKKSGKLSYSNIGVKISMPVCLKFL